MKTFRIDETTHDIVFDGQNNMSLVENEQEEEQSLRLLLSTNAGEFFLNILHGLVFRYLQQKVFDEERARIEISMALYQEPRVKEVQEISFEIDKVKRKLIIRFKVKMHSGNIISSSEVVTV